MTKSEIRQIVEVQAQALGPVLHAGAATSLAASLTRNKGLRHDKYPHLMPLTVRAEMREFLESDLVPNGWLIGGDSRKMGQLLLTHADLNMEMQFLKERRRTYPGGVPVAGKNETRRQRWFSDPLDVALPEPPQIETADPVRLLLLWDFLDAQTLDQFTLRIVHTLAPGVYGKAVPCDLIVDVQDGGSIFSHLKFPGSPEDDDFFMVEIANEEDESGS
jgi:hypothetical protein